MRAGRGRQAACGARRDGVRTGRGWSGWRRRSWSYVTRGCGGGRDDDLFLPAEAVRTVAGAERYGMVVDGGRAGRARGCLDPRWRGGGGGGVGQQGRSGEDVFDGAGMEPGVEVCSGDAALAAEPQQPAGASRCEASRSSRARSGVSTAARKAASDRYQRVVRTALRLVLPATSSPSLSGAMFLGTPYQCRNW